MLLITIENNNFIRNEKFVIFLVEEIDMCDWKIKKKLSFNLEKLNCVIKNHINRVEIIRNLLNLFFHENNAPSNIWEREV